MKRFMLPESRKQTGKERRGEGRGKRGHRRQLQPQPQPMLDFVILLSKQGKVRLSKWYSPVTEREKNTLIRDITAIIPLRRARMCNVIEYRDSKIVYRRYASLFFVVGISSDDNELLALEIIQRYVESMDKAYGNVCELDIVFNFQLAYHVLDELIIGGELCEPSGSEVLRKVAAADALEDEERLRAR
jgi:AP-1 complex subunit sigma 1/2